MSRSIFVLTSLGVLAAFSCAGGGPPDAAATPGDGMAIARERCSTCHSVAGQGGTIAASLETSVATAAERIAAYEEVVADLRERYPETHATARETIERILDAEGDERLRRWLTAYLDDPMFDNPESAMPPVDLVGADRDALLDALLSLR